MKNGISEDVYFCNKASNVGIELWAHPKVICSHIKEVDLLDWVPTSHIVEMKDIKPEMLTQEQTVGN